MTLIYYDDVFLEHDTGGHPENRRRLEVIAARLKHVDFVDKLKFTAPRDATQDEIALVHNATYIDAAKAFCESGGGFFDPDTIASKGTYKAAIAAAGSGLDAVSRILSGEDKSAFCLVRPPGHHAERGRAMGFCVFNNIAIAGKWLQKEKGMKIAVVDFDVHHCNGTQDAFYTDPGSIVVSLHRFPFYPGMSGSPGNTGEGEGADLNINIAMDTFVYPADYIYQLEEAIERVVEFKPGFLLVSAGFDAYAGDPLADFNLEVEDYGKIGELLQKTASEVCEGRICCFLEGGYNIEMLPTLVETFLRPIAAGGG